MLEHALEVGLEGEQVGRVRGRGAEAGGVGHGKEAADDFTAPTGAVRFGQERQDVGADQGARLRRIMRGAGDAHGADGRRRKTRGVCRVGGALQNASLAAQGAPVFSLTGDGGFNMMLGELETARRLKLKFAVIVVINAASGYV